MVNKIKKSAFALLLLLQSYGSFGQSMDNFPREIKMVFNYILKSEYLELIGDSSKAYQLRPVDWTIIDIDNDGKTEVFLLTYPHYAQSAPIQIYQIQPDSTVIRIKEALSPGKVVTRTGDYLDTHNGGYAIDMTAGQVATKDQKRKLSEISMQNGMTVIEFPDFFHTDIRMNKGGGYVDLSQSKQKIENRSCAGIQLAKPSAITSCKSPGNYFAVVVEKEIWLYKIKKIDSSGFLDKEVLIMKLPKDYAQLNKDQRELLYTNKKGSVKQIIIKE